VKTEGLPHRATLADHIVPHALLNGGEMTVRVNSYDPAGNPRSASFMLTLLCREG
jgi:hypothetical protein